MLALVHGDPRNPQTHDIIPELSDALGGFLVGGLTSSRTNYGQFGGRPGTAPVIEGGVSGVLFSSEVPVATGLTQGCTPIGPAHKITRAQNNIIVEIDGRPALDVFKEDIGELLARDLRRVAGYIFAALPITGSDTGDYLVRNLVGIDPNHGLIAIGDMVEPGRSIMFAQTGSGERPGRSGTDALGHQETAEGAAARRHLCVLPCPWAGAVRRR